MSTLKTIQVIIKLLPSLIALKKHRKEWVKKEGRNIDQEKYRKNAQRVLRVFIELGPVYIKLGQWLSSRADILPQPYMEELAKLQDDVPAEPFDKVRPTIESDIGNIDEKFDELETKELSGASLGQVYRGKINGQAVVLKVKRPGIEKMVDDEIEVLKKILPIGMRFVDKNLRFSVDGMLAQFIETIHEEMDYKKESDNLKTISENIKEYENVLIPKVYDHVLGRAGHVAGSTDAGRKRLRLVLELGTRENAFDVKKLTGINALPARMIIAFASLAFFPSTEASFESFRRIICFPRKLNRTLPRTAYQYNCAPYMRAPDFAGK